MTFVIIMYNVCNMNHLTQPTKWIICIVYDRVHVIFLLVVGVKPFPLYIIWLEADGGCNYHEIRNEVTKPGNVVQMIALTLYKNLFILDLVRFSLLQIQSPKAQKRQLIVTPKKKKKIVISVLVRDQIHLNLSMNHCPNLLGLYRPMKGPPTYAPLCK